MIRRPWLLPVTIPLVVLWLVFRIARLPLNAVLWACSEALDYLITGEISIYWPSWRQLWGTL